MYIFHFMFQSKGFTDSDLCLFCVEQLCQKAGEISLLKQQLRESQGEVTQRAGEMVALRGQLKDLNGQLREREEAEISLKESFCTKTLELERCEAELQTMLAEVQTRRLRVSLSVVEMWFENREGYGFMKVCSLNVM